MYVARKADLYNRQFSYEINDKMRFKKKYTSELTRKVDGKDKK